jgi:hypothetical protein
MRSPCHLPLLLALYALATLVGAVGPLVQSYEVVVSLPELGLMWFRAHFTLALLFPSGTPASHPERAHQMRDPSSPLPRPGGSSASSTSSPQAHW